MQSPLFLLLFFPKLVEVATSVLALFSYKDCFEAPITPVWFGRSSDFIKTCAQSLRLFEAIFQIQGEGASSTCMMRSVPALAPDPYFAVFQVWHPCHGS